MTTLTADYPTRTDTSVTLGNAHALDYRPRRQPSRDSSVSASQGVSSEIARSLSPKSTADRTRHLQHELGQAMAFAERESFDLPSPEARYRAGAVIGRIARGSNDIAPLELIEVTVAEDGAIEFTAALRRWLLTIEVPPTGARTALLVQDRATGTVRHHIPDVNLMAIADALERGA